MDQVYQSLARSHSSILNSGYMLYTVKVLYSKTIFFTDEEYYVKFGRRLNIQSVVEQPEIYIVAKCSDTIAQKLAYIDVRREDLKEMETPLVVNDVVLKDTMRFFQGTYFIQAICIESATPPINCLLTDFSVICYVKL